MMCDMSVLTSHSRLPKVQAVHVEVAKHHGSSTDLLSFFSSCSPYLFSSVESFGFSVGHTQAQSQMGKPNTLVLCCVLLFSVNRPCLVSTLKLTYQ